MSNPNSEPLNIRVHGKTLPITVHDQKGTKALEINVHKNEPTPPNLDIVVHTPSLELPINLNATTNIASEQRVVYNEEWARHQVEVFRRSFGTRRIDTPIHKTNQIKQQYTYDGKRYCGENVSSCVAASVTNALVALGEVGVKEQDVINQIGGFNSAGSMSLVDVGAVFSGRGFAVSIDQDLSSIGTTLEQGGLLL